MATASSGQPFFRTPRCELRRSAPPGIHDLGSRSGFSRDPLRIPRAYTHLCRARKQKARQELFAASRAQAILVRLQDLLRNRSVPRECEVHLRFRSALAQCHLRTPRDEFALSAGDGPIQLAPFGLCSRCAPSLRDRRVHPIAGSVASRREFCRSVRVTADVIQRIQLSRDRAVLRGGKRVARAARHRHEWKTTRLAGCVSTSISPNHPSRPSACTSSSILFKSSFAPARDEICARTASLERWRNPTNETSSMMGAETSISAEVVPRFAEPASFPKAAADPPPANNTPPTLATMSQRTIIPPCTRRMT